MGWLSNGHLRGSVDISFLGVLTEYSIARQAQIREYALSNRVNLNLALF